MPTNNKMAVQESKLNVFDLLKGDGEAVILIDF